MAPPKRHGPPTVHQPPPSRPTIFRFGAFIAAVRQTATGRGVLAGGAVRSPGLYGTRTLCISAGRHCPWLFHYDSCALLALSACSLPVPVPAQFPLPFPFSLILVLFSGAFMLFKCHIFVIALPLSLSVYPIVVALRWLKQKPSVGIIIINALPFPQPENKSKRDEIKRCHSCSWVILTEISFDSFLTFSLSLPSHCLPRFNMHIYWFQAQNFNSLCSWRKDLRWEWGPIDWVPETKCQSIHTIDGN